MARAVEECRVISESPFRVWDWDDVVVWRNEREYCHPEKGSMIYHLSGPPLSNFLRPSYFKMGCKYEHAVYIRTFTFPLTCVKWKGACVMESPFPSIRVFYMQGILNIGRRKLFVGIKSAWYVCPKYVQNFFHQHASFLAVLFMGSKNIWTLLGKLLCIDEMYILTYSLSLSVVVILLLLWVEKLI